MLFNIRKKFGTKKVCSIYLNICENNTELT